VKVYTHEVCPRIRKCGFFTPPEVLASLVGYHRERGYRQDEVLDMGYIKYTLVNESTQHHFYGGADGHSARSSATATASPTVLRPCLDRPALAWLAEEGDGRPAN